MDAIPRRSDVASDGPFPAAGRGDSSRAADPGDRSTEGSATPDLPWWTRLHRDAYARLDGWEPPSGAQQAMRTAYLSFLAEHPDAAARTCAAGHLTASTLIVDADAARVLLTLHPKVGRWLQVGGHLEPRDRSLTAAAAREAAEESGISDLLLASEPLRLDRHRGHCRRDLPVAAWPYHLDVQFLAIAPVGARPQRSAESVDLRWFAWDDLPGLPDPDPALLKLATRARERLRKSTTGVFSSTPRG